MINLTGNGPHIMSSGTCQSRNGHQRRGPEGQHSSQHQSPYFLPALKISHRIRCAAGILSWLAARTSSQF
jgi:hypothetical protein